MKKLSLCMIVKNEAQNLPDFFEAHKALIDEWIIVDTGSTDDTVKIVEKLVGKCHHFVWCDDFSAARNYSLSLATGDWILVLDADEILDPANQQRVKDLVKLGQEDAYLFTQRSYTNNASLIGFVRNKNLTLYQKNSAGYFDLPIVRLIPNKKELGLRYVQRIHEGIEYLDKNKKPVATDVILHHYGHLKKDVELKEKNALYFALEKKRIAEQPDDAESQRQYAAACLCHHLYKEALEHYDASFALEKHHPTAYYGAALACYYLHDTPRALTYIKMGLTAYPDRIELLTLAARITFDAGEINNAKQLVLEAEKTDYDTSDTWYYFGCQQMKNQVWQTALEHFECALKKNPVHQDSLYNASLVLEILGNKEKSLSYLSRLLELNPQDTQAQNQIKKLSN